MFPLRSTQDLGSVRVTLNQGGIVVGRDDYFPFGLHNLSRSFRMPGRSSNSANRDNDQKACPDHSGFTGHFFEQEGDLDIPNSPRKVGAGWDRFYHAQARMYDPATGRFWGVDAMRSEYPFINPYHYALNNTILYIDPTGMWVVKIGGEAIGTYVPVVAGNASVGITFDQHGNIGSYQTAGVAFGLILGGVAGVGGKVYPMADNIHDISGSGIELAGFAVAGKGGKLSLDPSISDQGPGLGGASQWGMGLGLHLNITETAVQEWGNVFELFGTEAASEIMNKMETLMSAGEEINLNSIFTQDQLEIINRQAVEDD